MDELCIISSRKPLRLLTVIIIHIQQLCDLRMRLVPSATKKKTTPWMTVVGKQWFTEGHWSSHADTHTLWWSTIPIQPRPIAVNCFCEWVIGSDFFFFLPQQDLTGREDEGGREREIKTKTSTCHGGAINRLINSEPLPDFPLVCLCVCGWTLQTLQILLLDLKMLIKPS